MVNLKLLLCLFSEGDEIIAYIVLGGLQVNSEKTKAGVQYCRSLLRRAMIFIWIYHLQQQLFPMA